MINQIYLSVLFRAKSVKENIYKSLLTLSTSAHWQLQERQQAKHIRTDHKTQAKQLPRTTNNKDIVAERAGASWMPASDPRSFPVASLPQVLPETIPTKNPKNTPTQPQQQQGAAAVRGRLRRGDLGDMVHGERRILIRKLRNF